MSDEQQTTEIDYSTPIGRPDGLNYEPIVPISPVKKPETADEQNFLPVQTDLTNAGDVDSLEGDNLRDIADDVARQRAMRSATKSEDQARAPLPRQYHDFDAKGNQQRPAPLHLVTTPAQGAEDLSAARRAEDAQTVAEMERAAIADLDRQAGAESAPMAEVPQPVEQSPVEQSPQEQSPADTLAAKLQDPEVMQAVQAYAAEIEQAKQAYVNGLAQNAATAYSAVAASFPELQSAKTVNDIPVIVSATAARDPQRAQAMAAWLGEVSKLAQTAQTAATQQQQERAVAYQQAYEKWGKAENDKWYKWALTQDKPERIKQISEFAKQMLLDDGMSEEEMAYRYNVDGSLRSERSQRYLYKLAKAELAQNGAQQKMVRPAVPMVQRPGSPAARAPENAGPVVNSDGFVVRGFKGGPMSPKQAAELLTNQRRRA